jgi:hypothetical protein
MGLFDLSISLFNLESDIPEFTSLNYFFIGFGGAGACLGLAPKPWGFGFGVDSSIPSSFFIANFITTVHLDLIYLSFSYCLIIIS